ncbi:MAG: hypothetical protein V7K32_23170 [Nostoc sp.]
MHYFEDEYHFSAVDHPQEKLDTTAIRLQRFWGWIINDALPQ